MQHRARNRPKVSAEQSLRNAMLLEVIVIITIQTVVPTLYAVLGATQAV